MEWVEQTGSTNADLLLAARAGQLSPQVLVAQRQTAGRGRMGRVWRSAPGSSLTFSLGLCLEPVQWSGLSLAVGVALAQALHPDVRLKWPNDLWWQERKLAGILIETTHRGNSHYAVIGVGLNIAEPPEDPAGLAGPVAWVREFWPEAHVDAVLERVLLPLARAMKQFESLGFAAFQAAFEQRDALRGRQVGLSDGTQGIAQGVDTQAALLVHTVHGVQAVTTSEVSVRVHQDVG